MEKLTINETIVVEGKDDYANIKRFVDADIIITHGFGISKGTLQRIRRAAAHKGIIVFTDPDYAGENIRRKIVDQVKDGIKHAYITREEGEKKGNIGVENAGKDAILEALMRAKPVIHAREKIYTVQDMGVYGLAGGPQSKALRTHIGKVFRIGYGNAKQLCERLNAYQVPKEALEKELAEYLVNNEYN